MRASRWILPAVTVLLAGCASMGPPVPPSLKIPEAVRGLAMVERGDSLIIDFTVPARTTDGIGLKRLDRIELEINGRKVPVTRIQPGPVHLALSAQSWTGQNIAVRVRAVGPSGRPAAWSNEVRLKVLPPLAQPQVRAEAAPAGVRLSWASAGPGVRYRVYRLGPGEANAVLIATVTAPEYLDTQAQFGKRYQYSVQAFEASGDSEVQSETSAAAQITPANIFPPAVPTGVSAVAGVGSIDLTWTPDTEPDLKGYYVYRSAGGAPFTRLGEMLSAPAFTDRAIQSGVQYRYEVSAVDQNGNESARSAPAEAVAP